jgi:hypothetical protein
VRSPNRVRSPAAGAVNSTFADIDAQEDRDLHA